MWRPTGPRSGLACPLPRPLLRIGGVQGVEQHAGNTLLPIPKVGFWGQGKSAKGLDRAAVREEMLEILVGIARTGYQRGPRAHRVAVVAASRVIQFIDAEKTDGIVVDLERMPAEELAALEARAKRVLDVEWTVEGERAAAVGVPEADEP